MSVADDHIAKAFLDFFYDEEELDKELEEPDGMDAVFENSSEEDGADTDEEDAEDEEEETNDGAAPKNIDKIGQKFRRP